MFDTNDENVLLIVTGSIAAYKTTDLVRALEKQGYQLTTLLTQAGQQFVSIEATRSLSRTKIYFDQDATSLKAEPMLHISLARQHKVILVAPASANFIAKMAAGLADGLALDTLLAFSGRVLIAPAMNPQMWQHPATQANIATLRQRGVEIIEPIHGIVACGDEGVGKYAGLDAVLQALRQGRSSAPLAGKKAVITLGGTRAALDYVRYIGNYSTGQQGLSIAQALHQAGCAVHLVCGHVSVDIPAYFEQTKVSSNQEMLDACQAYLPADIFIGCAAACDYKIKSPYKGKLKKQRGNAEINLELVADVDVIANIALTTKQQRPNFMIGFALEADSHLSNAQEKLQHKNLDIVVSNDVSELDATQKTFSVIGKNGLLLQARMSKRELAEQLSRITINHFCN